MAKGRDRGMKMDNAAKRGKNKDGRMPQEPPRHTQLISLVCPSCGAPMKQKSRLHMYCPYCATEKVLEDSIEVSISIQASDKKREKTPSTEKKSGKKTGLLFVTLSVLLVVAAGALFYAKGRRAEEAYEPADVVRCGLEQIFDKQYSAITPQELHTITYFHVSQNNLEGGFQVEYSFRDYEAMGTREAFENTIEVCQVKKDAAWSHDYTDLTGLTYLYDDSQDQTLKLSKDAQIRVLYGKGSAEKYADLLPYPQRVKEMYMDGGESLSGIDSFTGLEILQCEPLNSSDLKEIGQCSGLKKLTMDAQNECLDIRPLCLLTELEELYLNCAGLTGVDSLSGMTHLRRLDMPYSYTWHPDAFPVLPELAEIRLRFYGSQYDENAYDRSLTFLCKQPSIQRIALCSGEGRSSLMEYICGLEEVLNMEQLEELKVEHCKMAVRKDLVEDNRRLQHISFCYVDLKAENEREPWDFLGHMKAVEELTVRDCGVRSIDFLAGCSTLKICDITSNRVSDYSVFEQLPGVSVLYCADNAGNLEQIPDTIEVITQIANED